MKKKLVYASLVLLTVLATLLLGSQVLLSQPTSNGMIPGFMRGTTQPASTAISPAPPAREQGRWVSKAALPIPRTEMTWAAVWDNKMHVIGGYNYKGGFDIVMGGEGSSGVFAQVEAYDPVTNKWESLAPMPTPRHGMGAVAIEDMVYVAGGGPVTGGSLMTSTNEALALASRSSQK